MKNRNKCFLFTPKLITVFISIIFSSQSIIAEEILDLNSLFGMSLEELMNVEIVTAGKKPEKIRDVPASVVVVTREDIESYGYTSLEEIIANVTGYYVIDNWCYTYAMPGVRGFYSQSGTGVIILINGIDQSRKGLESFSLRESNVPVECIDKIEIVRGPMSIMYGTGAFYGVINIITDENTEEYSSGQFSITMGAYNTRKSTFSIKGKRDDLQYSFNGGYKYSYGRNISLSELTDDTTAINMIADHQWNTGGRLEGWDRYFDLSIDLKSFFIKMTFNEMMQEVYSSFISTDEGNKIENLKTNIIIGYKKEFSDKINFHSSFRYNTLNNIAIVNMWKNDYYANEDLRARSYEGEIHVDYLLSDKLEITTGLSQKAMIEYYQVWDYTEYSTFYNNHRRELDHEDDLVTRSFYFQSNYSPIDKMRVIAGFRLEKMSDYGLEMSYGSDTTAHNMRTKEYGRFKNEGLIFIPRVALIYDINKTNILKLFYGEAIKHPAFSENIFNIANIAEYGYLESEKIRTSELNYSTSPYNHFNLSLSIFHNELDDLITRVYRYDDPDHLVSFQANGGRYSTNGTELMMNFKLLDKIQLKLSGSYQKSKDKRSGYEDITVAYSPEFLGYSNLTYKNGDLSILLSCNYVDSMESFWDDGPTDQTNGDFTPIGRIGEKVDSHINLGLNFRHENLFKKGLYLNAKIYNILDQEIRYPATTNNRWVDKGTLGNGRSIFVTTGWKF